MESQTIDDFPSRRELIRQLIDLRVREDNLQRQVEKLKSDNKLLKEQLKGYERGNGKATIYKQRLDHALRELAQKKQRAMLSDEEWQLIREFRGECT